MDGLDLTQPGLRLGVFGGTFDPPHVGHLILAEEARCQLALDAVLWVLTPQPPHKTQRQITPLEIRLKLLQAAITDDAHSRLSTVDIDRPPPHYAVDTLVQLGRDYPAAQLFYLIGGDSLHDLPRWHNPQGLLQACQNLGVMRRPNDRLDLPALEASLPGLSARLRWIDAPQVDISATYIRTAVRECRAWRSYLPPAVSVLVAELGLYRAAGG
jgi:nicotinate-nucleotide adenylyltransferase